MILLSRRVFRAGLLGLTGFFIVQSLGAQSWQSEQFIQSVRREAPIYLLNFWALGFQSVSRIKFNEDGVDQYRPLRNIMYLNDNLSDGGGRLKELAKIHPNYLATLAHESFHSYLQNYVRKAPALRIQNRWMLTRPKQLYRELSDEKAAIALEEGYASLIGMLVQSHVSILRMLNSSGRQEEKCESAVSLSRKLWSVNESQQVFGYYSRDGIGEYWTDRFKNLWSSITGKESGLPEDGTYPVNVALETLDRQWVYREIFQNRFQDSFEESFKEVLKDLPCMKSSEDLL